MKVPKPLLLLLFFLKFPASTTVLAQDSLNYFVIRVIDMETGRGIPMVELTSINDIRYITDSRGIIAFNEPVLMNREVVFSVFSHGYEGIPDGILLHPMKGKSTTIKLKRKNIAERLYRITGMNIYGESTKIGLPAPIKQEALNGGVMGQDTYIEIVYHGKIYWFWGDTNLPDGMNFKVTGATSELPGKGGLDPEKGIDLHYFVKPNGRAKSMCPFPGKVLVWIDWLAVLKNNAGKECLYAFYTIIEESGHPGECGFALFNDTKEEFEKVKVFNEWHGQGHYSAHPCVIKTEGKEYLYIFNNNGFKRVEANEQHLLNPASYECYTCLPGNYEADTGLKPMRSPEGKLVFKWMPGVWKYDRNTEKKLIKNSLIKEDEAFWQSRDVVTGNKINMDPQSVAWNEYRKRWIMIGYVFTGEVWLFEGDSPLGPWTYGRNILKQHNYDFYNSGHHPLFDSQAGKRIYFEGTYTTGFIKNEHTTPLYEYNQMMYALQLDDERLSLPQPVYEITHGTQTYLMKEGLDHFDSTTRITQIPFYAIPLSRTGTDWQTLYSTPSKNGCKLSTLPVSKSSKALCKVLPATMAPKANQDNISGTWVCMERTNDTIGESISIELKKDGNRISVNNNESGYISNDTAYLTYRLFDYNFTAIIVKGKIAGTFFNDDHTHKGNFTGYRTKATIPVTEPSSAVLLYEYLDTFHHRYIYSINPGLNQPGFIKTELPVCRVWANPESILRLNTPTLQIK